MKDIDDDLPSAAAYALGRLGPEAKAAIPALTAAVQTKTNNQRLRAAAALALWLIEPESQEAHPVLLDVLREPGTNETLIATVRRNLASSGSEALPRLFVLGQALDSNIQAPALQSLEGMGAESEGPLLSPQAP